MKRWKKIGACGLALALLLGNVSPVTILADGTSESAESRAAEEVNSLSPTDEVEVEESEGEDGMILATGDEKLLTSSNKGTSSNEEKNSHEGMVGAGGLPSDYSTVASGSMTNVTNQGDSDLCWVFAGLDNAQIELLNAGVTNRTDALFSAGHLAYTAYHGGGDSWQVKQGRSNTPTIWYTQGGNYRILGSSLARWYGAASAGTYSTPMSESAANGYSVAAADFSDDLSHLDSYERLPQPNDEDDNSTRNADLQEIKEAVYQYGSVAIDYRVRPQNQYYDSSTNSFYSDEKVDPDHQGLIVGWDDSKVTEAPHRGAFLIKNTWGTQWGENGYHWLAYDDQTMVNPVVYHMERDVSGDHDYTGNYYYDGVGYHDVYYFSEKVDTANVFTAVRDESVSAVGTYIPAGGNYTVSLYTGLTDGTPNTGRVAATATGTKENFGYYTIPLNREIDVQRGEKFAVSVSVSTGSGRGRRYVTFFEQGGSSGSYYRTTASSGESYMSRGGQTWTDTQGTRYAAGNNVCIHALTQGTEPFRFEAQRNPEYNQMYRLYNPNTGEHFYTANNTERRVLIRAGWRSEGIGWNAPFSGNAVYRLYNPNAGDHHYTQSAAERDALVKAGWRYEGIGWRSGGSVPLYRQYNPNASTGTHNYTKNRVERDALVKIGWNDEGIGWYAVS